MGTAAGQAGRPVAVDVQWSPMPLRSPHQLALGMPGGEGGQCLHGIARSASDDRRIYLAVDVVGVWRSINGGQSWDPCRNNGLYCLGTSSIAVHPRNPDWVLVYVNAEWEKDREAEEGLYQSADGGKNWVRVLEVPNEDKRRGYRHLVDFSRDGRRVFFAAFDRGLYRSDNGGLEWKGPLALKGTVAWEVKVDPRDPDCVWIGTDEGLFVSRDGGATVSQIKALEDDPITSVNPDPAVAGRILALRHGQGLMRSDDGGARFAALTSRDDELDATARHFFQSPIDPRRIILAGDKKMGVTHDGGATWKAPRIDWSRSYVQQGGWGFHNGFAWSARDRNSVVGALSCGMYASADGGLSWTDAMTGYTGFNHGWSDAAVSFSDDPNRFAFFCFDYGLNITLDGGRTFENRRLKEPVRGWWGMYAGDMSPGWRQRPVIVAAAGNYWKTQLVRSEDGGTSWTSIPSTEGTFFFLRFDPRDDRVVYADNRRSDDGGKTFRMLDRTVAALAPSRPDVVYGYHEGQVWRSDDRGDTWKALPRPPLPAGPHNGRVDLEVNPKDPDVIWAMTPPHCAVFDGRAWRLVHAADWAPPRAHAFVNRFAIDPDRPERIVLGLDAHGAGYLFFSEDAGITWRGITGNLPRLGSGQSLNIQPGTGRVFIGGGFGTWTADRLGSR